MVLVALAVSVPAVITSLVLGYQLDRQARMLFANGLAANLETFSLILQEIQTNSFEGLTRTAADNTLQVTVDLDIRPQLTKYLETQRQVLRMTSWGFIAGSPAPSHSPEASRTSRKGSGGSQRRAQAKAAPNASSRARSISSSFPAAAPSISSLSCRS
jgi:hypothetical protein